MWVLQVFTIGQLVRLPSCHESEAGCKTRNT